MNWSIQINQLSLQKVNLHWKREIALTQVAHSTAYFSLFLGRSSSPIPLPLFQFNHLRFINSFSIQSPPLHQVFFNSIISISLQFHLNSIILSLIMNISQPLATRIASAKKFLLNNSEETKVCADEERKRKCMSRE